MGQWRGCGKRRSPTLLRLSQSAWVVHGALDVNWLSAQSLLPHQRSLVVAVALHLHRGQLTRVARCTQDALLFLLLRCLLPLLLGLEPSLPLPIGRYLTLNLPAGRTKPASSTIK